MISLTKIFNGLIIRNDRALISKDYEIKRYNLFDQRENDIFYNSIINKLDSRRIGQPGLLIIQQMEENLFI